MDESAICTIDDFTQTIFSKTVLLHYFNLYHLIQNKFKDLYFQLISENFE